jgi:hypothetical protein
MIFIISQGPMLATHDSSYNTRAAPTKVALPKKLAESICFPRFMPVLKRF